MKRLLGIFFFGVIASALAGQTRQSYLDSLKKNLAFSKDTNKVLILAELADRYGFMQPDSSFYYARQTLDLAQKLNYLYGEYLGYQNLYFTFNTLGDYPKVLETEFNALKIAEQLPDRRQSSMAKIHMYLGFVYREMGDYPKAMAHHREAVRLQEASGKSLATLHSSFNTPTQVHLELKRLDSALWYAQKVYDLGQQSKTLASIDLAIVGNVYEALGNNKLATEYYELGIKLSEKDGDTYFRARLYNNLANLFDKLGKSDSSIYFARAALQISQINKFLNYQLNSAKILARIYESQRKSDSEVIYLKMTMATTDSIFGQAKVRQFHATGFSEEQRQQELNIARERYRNQIKLYALLGILGLFSVLAFILYRNNIRKKRANSLLEKQKNEIDLQRSIAEKTLEELKSAQTQLIQSEKMASLGELTAGIAHEIQNPLNFVNNFSEVNTELVDELKTELATGNMQQAIDIADNIKENEQKINHHGKRADAIVKGMLQHSRASSGQKELTDINVLADEYVRLCYHGLRAKDKSFNATLKTELDNTIEKINIIPQDVGRVIWNLTTNAFYAVIEKKKKNPNGYEPTVTVTTKKLAGKIEVRVGDNGNGIPQKVLDKIFQPFFTTKPTRQGTGLGLSLSYDIVKAHGGELKVETKEGEGSEFIIQLPG
jgi:two-component system NtrC family sensor kinase